VVEIDDFARHPSLNWIECAVMEEVLADASEGYMMDAVVSVVPFGVYMMISLSL